MKKTILIIVLCLMCGASILWYLKIKSKESSPNPTPAYNIVLPPQEIQKKADPQTKTEWTRFRLSILSQLRAEGPMYYESHNSYIGFCNSEYVTSKNIGHMICNESSTAWALSTQTENGYACADSTGTARDDKQSTSLQQGQTKCN